MDEYKLEDGCVVHCLGKPSTLTTTASTPPATVAPVAAATATAGASVTAPPATSAAAAATASSSSTADALTAALERLKAENDPSTFLTAVTTLSKVIDNIVSHPMVS